MDKMIKAMLCAASIAALLHGSAQAAEDEIAPGYNACIQSVGDDYNEKIACALQANKHWENEVNRYYKLAIKDCTDRTNVDEKSCKATINDAMGKWNEFRQSLMPAMYNVVGGGNYGNFKATESLARATRLQAELLREFDTTDSRQNRLAHTK